MEIGDRIFQNDMLLQLHKELQPESSEYGQLQVLLDKIRDTHPIGMYVKIKHTNHIGIIDSYNQRTGGFYPGIRYPINVYIIYSDCEEAVGSFFEYTVDQVEVVDLNELAYNDVLNNFPHRSDVDVEIYMQHYNEWANL